MSSQFPGKGLRDPQEPIDHTLRPRICFKIIQAAGRAWSVDEISHEFIAVELGSWLCGDSLDSSISFCTYLSFLQ